MSRCDEHVGCLKNLGAACRVAPDRSPYHAKGHMMPKVPWFTIGDNHAQMHKIFPLWILFYCPEFAVSSPFRSCSSAVMKSAEGLMRGGAAGSSGSPPSSRWRGARLTSWGAESDPRRRNRRIATWKRDDDLWGVGSVWVSQSESHTCSNNLSEGWACCLFDQRITLKVAVINRSYHSGMNNK